MIRFFFSNNKFVSRNLESIPVTFWTSHQLITRPQQPSALALTPSANLEFPVSLTLHVCGMWGGAGGNHADAGKTYKQQAERSQAWETNPQPLTTLATAPPSWPHRSCNHALN